MNLHPMTMIFYLIIIILNYNNLIKNKYALPKKIERQVEYIVLSDIDKLVSSSPNIVHRSTGAYYVLTAFVEISPECAECMPWLIQ